jgi:hypothetical protein
MSFFGSGAGVESTFINTVFNVLEYLLAVL